MPAAKPATPKNAMVGDSRVGQDASRPLSAKRIPELDGIRGVAILFIVLWHFVGHPLKPADTSGLSPLWRMIPRICELLSKHRTKVYVVFGVLLTGIVGIAYYSPHFLSIEMTRWGRTWFALFYFVLLMIAVVYNDSILAALMRSASLRSLGLISYSLYLVHQIVLSLTLAFLFPNIERTGFVVLLPTLVAFVLAVAVSAGLYQSVEKPIMRYGHKFRYA